MSGKILVPGRLQAAPEGRASSIAGLPRRAKRRREGDFTGWVAGLGVGEGEALYPDKQFDLLEWKQDQYEIKLREIGYDDTVSVELLSKKRDDIEKMLREAEAHLSYAQERDKIIATRNSDQRNSKIRRAFKAPFRAITKAGAALLPDSSVDIMSG